MTTGHSERRPRLAMGDSSLTDTAILAQRQQAARALLMSPLLTAKGHRDQLALVRRHAAPLKSAFQTSLGYGLVVEARFARLSKAPLPADAPSRGAVRPNKYPRTPLTPRAYVFVALVCAALMAPGTGEQVLLSALVEQVRSDAAAAGIEVNKENGDRKALVVAVEQLAHLGVLAETDGTLAGWSERDEEALLTINQDLLPHLLTRPLAGLPGPGALTAPSTQDAEQQPRRALRRRLVENPLTRREDLNPAEADVLSRERTDISRVLEESFGLNLEVRAEGALAYDLNEELTDIAFPGDGTVNQAALLLCDALIDRHRPTAGATAAVETGEVPGLLCTWEEVADELDTLVAINLKAWRNGVESELIRLQNDVVARLREVGLAHETVDGIVLHAAAARFRPDPLRAPAGNQKRSIVTADDQPPIADNLALFAFDSEETS